MNHSVTVPLVGRVQLVALVWVCALLVFLTGGLVLLTGGLAQAQDSGAIEFPENSTGPVATFTAEDPEGATPIAWSVATSAQVAADADLADADNADAEHFAINKDGELTFAIGTDNGPPDFEVPRGTGPVGTSNTNTYKVVVVACDVSAAECAGGKAAYHKVEVKVTNVDEPGKVTLSASGSGTPQYLVGTTLTATASDGDIANTDQNFTLTDRAGVVTGIVWRWYRGSTEIATATSNIYTLQADDVGQHIRAVVFYVVAGNVDQEEASVTTDYPVLGTRVGASQLKFASATVSRTISEGAKGRNVGAPVTATGNHGTVEYSIVAEADNSASTDAALFKIDKKTGQITTNVVLDYESDSAASAQAAGSCAGATTDTPDRTCAVVVSAKDSTGDDDAATVTVNITLTDVDEAPTFASAGAQAIKVPENSTALWDDTDTTNYDQSAVTAVTYQATDPEGRTVSYSLAGPDASKFQLSGDPPILSFVSKPDFEAKASADGDNVYEVTIRASAGGKTGERTVRVTVGNVNEGPEITGPSTANFVENSKDPVATYTAEDPEGATPIAWSVAAADTTPPTGFQAGDFADASGFTIDKDGVLKFSSPPDYENATGGGSGGTSNTYKVVVAAADAASGGETGYHKVTVTVTKVDEPGKVTLATSTVTGTPQYLVTATLTATASDGDITDADQTFTVDRTGEVTAVNWRWFRGGGAISGATSNTYTLVDADVGQRIRVTVTYLVAGNTRQESASVTTDYAVLAARVGENALKFDPPEVSRTISEGAKGRNVGAPVTATGNHGTVRYSLDTGGDADKFAIDAKTGQITTDVVLDYEGEAAASATAAGSCADAASGSPDRACTVTVTAEDSTGDDPTNTLTVNITITDVDESPTFSTGAKAIDVPEGSTALWHGTAEGYTATTVDGATGVTYEAADPEGRTVTYSLAGPDASKFQLSGSPPVLSFVSKPDFEAKASADGDNVYEVTIRATAGGKTGERAVRVTVGNVDEAPTIRAGGLSILGPASKGYAENGTDAVAEYSLAGPLASSATWSLEGADAGDFTISGGMLSFRSAPDYENPADADTDNAYMVTVKADDGTYSDTHDVTVTVANVDEAGAVTLLPSSPSDGVEITATLADPDGSVSEVTWQWASSDTADGTFTPIAGATSASYTPAAGDVGKYLRATAMYTDGEGSGKDAEQVSANAVTAGDPLITKYDANSNGEIEKSEVITAINDYLDGGQGAPTKADVIKLINLYLDA